MAKEKKDSKMISMRISNEVDERINNYCEITGATRTSVMERAVSVFLDRYDEEQEFLKKNMKTG